MSNAVQGKLKEKSLGDTAVDGLFAGILAGLGMAAYLVVSGLLSGAALEVTLGRFDPAMDGRWLAGVLAHVAVSGVYGLIFALLFSLAMRLRSSFTRRSLLHFGWLIGLVYSLVLVALARGILLPIAGSPLLQIAALQLLIAHLIYGLLLGYLVSRKW